MCFTQMSHVTIQCSVDDPVDLSSFRHIVWKHEDDPETEPEAKASDYEQEEDDEDKHVRLSTVCPSPATVPTCLEEMGSVAQQAHGEAAEASVSRAATATTSQAKPVNMMLGPIPYNLRKDDIVQLLNQKGFQGKYLDLHMPENTNSKCRNENVGCFFATFSNTADADEFRHVFHGFNFDGSHRPCEVKLAHVKGVLPTRHSKAKQGRNNRNNNRANRKYGSRWTKSQTGKRTTAQDNSGQAADAHDGVLQLQS